MADANKASNNPPAAGAPAAASSNVGTLKTAVVFLGLTTVGLLVATIIFATNDNDKSSSAPAVKSSEPTLSLVDGAPRRPPFAADTYVNRCNGTKPDAPNVPCVVDAINEQSGANVTKGYNGLFNTTAEPITVPYFEQGLCPVNVHWHLGAEHYSAGQYDESGTGPSEINERRKLAGKTRLGFQCKAYDETDAKFTTGYDWQYCVDMEVGQTYEVHWPHSQAGACGTLDQYQTPFYDGVFCRAGDGSGDTVQFVSTAAQIGVQAQVFTIVNDESYYYPDLIKGMIVESTPSNPGNFGQDMAFYTGSTTGTSRSNEICSQYAPITWQVDRQCHLVSASSFDKMCKDMLEQRDDMSDDLYAHGSRELVADEFAANNHKRHLRR